MKTTYSSAIGGSIRLGRVWIRLRFVFACAVGIAVAISAQTSRVAAQQGPEKVSVNTGEVLFDVVVRDKQGRPVKDLRTSEFEVYEDGVKQELNSFRLVSPEASSRGSVPGKRAAESKNQTSDSRSGTPGASRVGAGPDSGITAVALVFDRLTPDARARAYKTALSYLGDNVAKGELVGVFLTDLSLIVFQPYTDDLQLAKNGVQKAAEHASSLYTSNNEQARELRAQIASRLGGAPAPKGNGSDISAEVNGLQLQLLGLERWEELQRDQQGNATTRGLLVIAESLRQLPGRKAVIFFSEGIALPPDVMESFRAAISSANRANVTFYTIDAAGLRAESKNAETNREITSRNNLRMAQESTNTEVSDSMMKGLERNEDLLRLNPDSSLGQLANQTGGFLITDTNDLKSRLQKIDEDLHTYYLMSYTSKNQNYDGHFRKIDVKLKRSGLTVQSRKGYYAIKGSYASPVLPYEVPALAALSNMPVPQSFPFHAVGFSFPEHERRGLAPVMVEVPMSSFTFKADKEKNLYSTDFSIVVLLKDQAGQVVEKLSNQYRLSGPLDKLDETKQRQVLFYREADLAAGRYTLEAIAYDASTGRASVRTSNLDVPEANDGKLRLSSIVIIKRAEQNNAADEKGNNPFHLANMIVFPNLGEPAQKAIKQLPFFFTAYTAPGTKTGPKLTIELRQRGRTLAQIPGDMPAPDALGRIQYMAGLPLESIPPGSYELKITISDGATNGTGSGFFSIAGETGAPR